MGSYQRQKSRIACYSQVICSKRSKENASIAHIDVPFSETTLHEHVSTSNMTTMEADQHREKQRKRSTLRESLLKDLHRATHESKTLHQVLCPDKGRTGIIVEALQQQRWVDVHNGFIRLRDWPQESCANENDYYQAFTNLLNAIIDNFKAHFPHAKSYWRDISLRFYPYDKELKEKAGFVAPLKPDFLAVPDTIGPFDSSTCSWLDAQILGEMKASWKSMTIQAASYARCAFAAANHRIFVPVFCFHPKNSILRLFFFHQGGLLATQEIHLASMQGFTHFVSIVVGMLSWANPTEAGYQTGQSHSHFKSDHKLYRIEEMFCRRLGVRGRVTHVYKPLLEPDQTAQPLKIPDHSGQLKTLEPLSRPNPIAPADSQRVSVFSLPENLVLKCSHPLAPRPGEEDIFNKVKGYIGIVDVLAAYDADCVCAPNDAIFWDLFDRKLKASPKPERRLHRHLLFDTIGRPLSAARGPQELGYAILHTIIGHCALFTIGDYLHRDISHGNILLLPNEEARLIPSLLQDIIDDHRCVAVLIDGDVARPWGDTRETGTHRSGTKPFLSHRVASNWSMVADMIHTPIDDLESFIWVLVFILLTLTADRTSRENYWLDNLRADDIMHVIVGKAEVMKSFKAATSLELPISAYLRVFRTLLHDWFKLAVDYQDRLEVLSSSEEMKELSLEAYKRFIKAGLEHIPSLPLEWPSISAEN